MTLSAMLIKPFSQISYKNGFMRINNVGKKKDNPSSGLRDWRYTITKNFAK